MACGLTRTGLDIRFQTPPKTNLPRLARFDSVNVGDVLILFYSNMLCFPTARKQLLYIYLLCALCVVCDRWNNKRKNIRVWKSFYNICVFLVKKGVWEKRELNLLSLGRGSKQTCEYLSGYIMEVTRLYTPAPSIIVKSTRERR